MVTYPRELHSYELTGSTFTLNDPVAITSGPGGRAIAVVDYADRYFTARFETIRLGLDARQRWEAWKDSLRGGMKSFLAWDVYRAQLAAHPAGVPEILAETWDGEGSVDSLEAHLVTATGAPEGLTMSEGDHIGLVEDGRRGLFRVVEDATAGATTIAVSVEPAVPTTIFTTSATVVFWRPKAEFILLTDSWSNPVNAEFAPVSFDAVQKI